jgi:hypothetical protein
MHLSRTLPKRCSGKRSVGSQQARSHSGVLHELGRAGQAALAGRDSTCMVTVLIYARLSWKVGQDKH